MRETLKIGDRVTEKTTGRTGVVVYQKHIRYGVKFDDGAGYEMLVNGVLTMVRELMKRNLKKENI